MGDGGVGEETLDVGLRHREHRADDHRQRGHRDDAHPPVPAVGLEADVDQAQDRAEGRDLGAGGHEAGDRRGSALVDVRRPRVERHGADLEQQADEQEHHPGDQQPVEVARGGRDRLGDVGEVDRSAVAVEQGRAEDEEARAERAEQEVLQRGLLREQPAATGEAREEVERQRQHLEGHEHREQVPGGREEQHAAHREHGQREDLAAHESGTQGSGLVRRARNGSTHRREGVRALAAEPLGHRQHAQNGHQQDRALQEQRRAVDDDGSLQRDALCVDGDGDERDERDHQGGDGDGHLRGVARGTGGEGLDEDTEDGPAEDDEHRGDRRVVDLRDLELDRQARGQGGHYFALPSAAWVGAGSVTPT